MPTGASIIAVAGLALSAGGAFLAQRQQKKAADEERKIAKAENRRARRQELRQAAIARAQIENTGVQVGGGLGSGVAGGSGSVASQAGANIGFINSTEAASLRISRANQKANTFAGVADTGGAVANFGFAAGAFQTPAQTTTPSAIRTPSGAIAARPF